MIYYNSIIDKYYPAGTALRDIYLAHCRAVADEAVAICRRCNLPLDENEVRAAAMLHDIGIYATDAPGIECRGMEPYIRHVLIGAELLRREGMPEIYARVAVRHTGAALRLRMWWNSTCRCPIVISFPRLCLSEWCAMPISFIQRVAT